MATNKEMLPGAVTYKDVLEKTGGILTGVIETGDEEIEYPQYNNNALSVTDYYRYVDGEKELEYKLRYYGMSGEIGFTLPERHIDFIGEDEIMSVGISRLKGQDQPFFRWFRMTKDDGVACGETPLSGIPNADRISDQITDWAKKTG